MIVYGETDKGKKWLIENVDKPNGKGGPSVVTRTFSLDLSSDVLEVLNKAGLTIED